MEDFRTAVLRWENLAFSCERTLDDICSNLGSISHITEEKTLELSQNFQYLASNAQKQSQNLNELIQIAKVVTVQNKEIEIPEISNLLQKTFVDSVSCILELSKQSMVMVYVLDDALKTLRQIEKSIQEIETINHKTKYLALNATIEAVRAGEVGESFQVVASEVRELSNDTQILATNIRSQVNEMANTLNRAQNILENAANVDMSHNVLAKEQLDDMMASLVENSKRMSAIMSEAARNSDSFKETAQYLVTGIQFQDRVKQDIDFILSSLKSVKSMFENLRDGKEPAEAVNHNTPKRESLSDTSHEPGEITLF